MPVAPTPPAMLNAQASNGETSGWAVLLPSPQPGLSRIAWSSFPKKWQRLFVRKCVTERKSDSIGTDFPLFVADVTAFQQQTNQFGLPARTGLGEYAREVRARGANRDAAALRGCLLSVTLHDFGGE